MLLLKEAVHPAFASLPPMLPECYASVAIPVRNEEARLWQTLSALADQHAGSGERLDAACYEVVLLLNQCTDRSEEMVRRFQELFPACVLHLAAWNFSGDDAHVGSARSLLLRQCALRHEAAQALAGRPQQRPRLLLTTDADTVVDRYWIAETARSIARGADAVGGDILTCAAERRTLPAPARRAYVLDRRYRRAVARLEALLDPLPHDPWPRHQHHFGGSLGCTLHAYRKSGGMQPVAVMEDVNFYHALLTSGARFRHEPRVRVYTSSRIHGRVTIGLSEQLGEWSRAQGLLAPATDLLVHTLLTRATLRRAMAFQVDSLPVANMLQLPATAVNRVLEQADTFQHAWQMLDGDARICALFPPEAAACCMQTELGNVRRLTSLPSRSAGVDPCDRLHDDVLQPAATMAC